MQLYGSYTSPYVRHCRIALIESGLDFEFVETDATASARLSPAQRVPFMIDGELQLSDSLAILAHIRGLSGRPLYPSASVLNRLCLATTVLDTAINLFFMARDGVDAGVVPYLQRQQARITTALAELEQQPWTLEAPFDDATLRLGVMIGWAQFRQRIDFSPYPRLQAVHQALLAYPPFADTQPRA